MAKLSARRKLIADSSALVALLSRDDRHHRWIAAQLDSLPWPWLTCDAALTETFYLIGGSGTPALAAMLRRGALKLTFDLSDELEPVMTLMEKYKNLPISLADACLVRMTEILSEPLVITTDADFRIYRRHSRQIVPCLLP